jgi:hypothetical protein
LHLLKLHMWLVGMDAGDTNVAAVQHHLGVRTLQKTARGKDGIDAN